MNFSFVLPTRGVKEPLLKMLDAFERTTKWKNKIEVLLAIDEGKTDIIPVVERQKYSYSIKFYERPLTTDFTNDYYNWLANRTVGDHIVAFNDDAWMRVNDWDKKVLGIVRQYPCKIYMVDMIDTARLKYGNQFPCFPCVSRRAFCAMGWLLHYKIPIYPADKITHDVYSRANRVIPIPGVIIEHEHIPATDNAAKHRMWDLFVKDNLHRKDKNAIPMLDIGPELHKLHLAAQSDMPLKIGKWTRIMNIVREE